MTMRPLFAALLMAFFATACGEETSAPLTGDPGPSTDPLADFSLPDVNPTSARFEDMVSPRDYLERVSAWYFGHAT